MPLKHVNTHPPSIIQQQLVEFHPLDLIGVGVGDERLGHHLPKIDVYLDLRSLLWWRSEATESFCSSAKNFRGIRSENPLFLTLSGSARFLG